MKKRKQKKKTFKLRLHWDFTEHHHFTSVSRPINPLENLLCHINVCSYFPSPSLSAHTRALTSNEKNYKFLTQIKFIETLMQQNQTKRNEKSEVTEEKKNTNRRTRGVWHRIVYGTLAVSSSCTTKLNHLNCLTKYLKFHRLISNPKTKTTTTTTTSTKRLQLKFFNH